MNDVVIIDDAIPQGAQDFIENTMLGSNFAWMYNSQQVDYGFFDGFDGDFGADFCNTPQFQHAFFADQRVTSDYFVPMVVPILSAMPFTVDTLLRAKSNMTLQNGKAKYGAPHIDISGLDNEFADEVLVGLYYANDSDGNTLIFNETESQISEKNLTIKAEITPKKGRLVVFNGKYLHAGNTPKENPSRLVININFLPHRSGKKITMPSKNSA